MALYKFTDTIERALRAELPSEALNFNGVFLENEIDGRLTYRRLIFMGLLSGLSFDEMGPMAPGLVCDLYTYRMRYDDEQHGIKRKKREIYD